MKVSDWNKIRFYESMVTIYKITEDALVLSGGSLSEETKRKTIDILLAIGKVKEIAGDEAYKLITEDDS